MRNMNEIEIKDELKALNKRHKVKIRAKKRNDGSYSIYLDTHISASKRNYEFLELYLTGNPTHDKEIWTRAYKARDIRESELEMMPTASTWKKKQDFKEYFLAISKTRSNVWSCAIKAFNEFNPKPIPFTAINNRLIEDYKDYLLSKLENNSAILYLGILKTALNESVKDEILQVNPAKYVSIRHLEKERTHLDQNELELLKNTPCKYSEVKRAFLFACYTGLRYSDIELLSWDKIDLTHGFISIRQKKTKELLTIPMIPQAKSLLSNAPGSGKVFGLPCPQWVNRIMKQWGEAAGISKNLTFHVARHTFAVQGLEAGIDIAVLQKLLGHTLLSTTMIYAKVSKNLLQQAAEKLNKHYGGDRQ